MYSFMLWFMCHLFILIICNHLFLSVIYHFFYSGYIDFIGFVMYSPFFLKLHNSMMNSKDISIRKIEETKDAIQEQLRSRSNTPRCK